MALAGATGRGVFVLFDTASRGRVFGAFEAKWFFARGPGFGFTAFMVDLRLCIFFQVEIFGHMGPLLAEVANETEATYMYTKEVGDASMQI